MKKVLRGLGKTALFGSGQGLGAVLYYAPNDIRKNPKQIGEAFMRVIRISVGALNIGRVYKFSEKSKSEKHRDAAEIVKDVCIANAGVYIKLGQLLATQEVIVPPEYSEVLSVMYQHAPVSSADEVRKTIESDFNTKQENIFCEFNFTPISSASIAQVHEARLKSTGERVAVKVQHGWLAENLPIDIMLTEVFVNFGEYFFVDDFKFRFLLYDLKKELPLELDFKHEAQNCENLRKILKDNPNVKIPNIYKEHIGTKVLVQEYMDDIVNIDKKDQLIKNNFNLNEIVNILSDTFMNQVFHHGIIHGDPHGGNVFARKFVDPLSKSERTQIVLLDMGVVKYLSDELRLNYAYLWKGIIRQDEMMIKYACERIGAERHYPLFAAMITRRPWSAIMKNTGSDVKSRLAIKKSKRELNTTKVNMMKYRKLIGQILNEIDPDLQLLFKINDYLTTIDNRLGSPINTFYYTAKYSMKEIDYAEKYKRNYFFRIWRNLQTNYILFKLRAATFISEFMLKYRPTVENEEFVEANLSEIKPLDINVTAEESKTMSH